MYGGGSELYGDSYLICGSVDMAGQLVVLHLEMKSA